MNLCASHRSAGTGLAGLGWLAPWVLHSLSRAGRGFWAFSSHGSKRGRKWPNRNTEGFLGSRLGIGIPSPQPHSIGQCKSCVQNKVKVQENTCLPFQGVERQSHVAKIVVPEKNWGHDAIYYNLHLRSLPSIIKIIACFQFKGNVVFQDIKTLICLLGYFKFTWA